MSRFSVLPPEGASCGQINDSAHNYEPTRRRVAGRPTRDPSAFPDAKVLLPLLALSPAGRVAPEDCRSEYERRSSDASSPSGLLAEQGNDRRSAQSATPLLRAYADYCSCAESHAAHIHLRNDQSSPVDPGCAALVLGVLASSPLSLPGRSRRGSGVEHRLTFEIHIKPMDWTLQGTGGEKLAAPVPPPGFRTVVTAVGSVGSAWADV